MDSALNMVNMKRDGWIQGVTMKILALDIGAGTLDILLYDEGDPKVENCIKMVLPSLSLRAQV